MLRSKEFAPSQDSTQIWKSREHAKKFWETSLEDRERIDWTIKGMDIRSDSRVLDIGAGPGTLAIPFAQKVAHVTAVEPAEGMISILREKMVEYNVENVSIVQKCWEDVDIESDLQLPYDAVIASFSLSMLDIREAILKMQTASSKHIYIYWFAGEISWDARNRELWSRLHDKDFPISPRSDVLFCVLYQMGIYPDVTTFSLCHKLRFSSIEEALDYLRPQYQVTTDQQELILRDYLDKNLINGDSSLLLRNDSIRVRISWEIGADKKQVIRNLE
jgi:16S rRNA G527 N7-methylase RsmG